jgi:hypothetical protein
MIWANDCSIVNYGSHGSSNSTIKCRLLEEEERPRIVKSEEPSTGRTIKVRKVRKLPSLSAIKLLQSFGT